METRAASSPLGCMETTAEKQKYGQNVQGTVSSNRKSRAYPRTTWTRAMQPGREAADAGKIQVLHIATTIIASRSTQEKPAHPKPSR